MQNTHWTIEEPCHEPLNKMTVINNGFFCHACQKKVFDLSLVESVPAESICGYIVQQKDPVVSPVNKWSQFFLRWLGTAALLFIPMKKGKSVLPGGNLTDPAGENKKAFGSKRIMGVVRDAANRPVRTTVQVSDQEGNVLAESRSMINGRYMVVLDTPAVDTPQIVITALDTTAYRIKLDTQWVINYPKDVIWIQQEREITAGVPPMIIVPVINIKLDQLITVVGPSPAVYQVGTTQTLESGAIAGAQSFTNHHI